ncbi:MAG: hypothetical protein ACYDAH_19360, partial [Steroidobacteraceae bacterium]
AALAESEKVAPEEGRSLALAVVYHAMGQKAESDAEMLEGEKTFASIAPFGIACVQWGGGPSIRVAESRLFRTQPRNGVHQARAAPEAHHE